MEIDEGGSGSGALRWSEGIQFATNAGVPSRQTIYSFDQSNRKLWIDRVSGKGVS